SETRNDKTKDANPVCLIAADTERGSASINGAGRAGRGAYCVLQLARCSSLARPRAPDKRSVRHPDARRLFVDRTAKLFAAAAARKILRLDKPRSGEARRQTRLLRRIRPCVYDFLAGDSRGEASWKTAAARDRCRVHRRSQQRRVVEGRAQEADLSFSLQP